MVDYNLTPFTATIDDPAHHKHTALVKASLQTIRLYSKNSNMGLQTIRLYSKNSNMGLHYEFSIHTQELPDLLK
jgi:hypothetical protein